MGRESKRVSASGEQQVDAVILDLGNVLVLHDNEQLFRTFGEYAGLSGDAVARLVPSALWSSIHLGKLDEEGIRREICGALKVEMDRVEFERVWNSHFTVNQSILPWVESLLGRVKLLLLSNTNAIHMRYLRGELPVLRRFDALVLSYELGLMKPDPAIYKEALRRAGSAPARTAFFDDLPEYVEAAKQVGIRAYVLQSVEQFASQLEALGLLRRPAGSESNR